MIPWHDFHSQPSCWNYSHPIGPHEEYLPFLQNGPSMAEVVFNTPMTELALERQFVVTQQGGDSAGFEREHTLRIDACLDVLDRNFHDFAGQVMQGSTTVPPSVDGVGLWTTTESLEIPFMLQIVHQEQSTREATSILNGPPTNSQAAATGCQTSEPPPAIPSHLIEDLEFSDDQDGDMVRSFLAGECHRSGRFRDVGTQRARKAIRQRRRSHYKAAQPSYPQSRKIPYTTPEHPSLNPCLTGNANFLPADATEEVYPDSPTIPAFSEQPYTEIGTCYPNWSPIDQT